MTLYDQMFAERPPTVGRRLGKLAYFPSSGDLNVDREAKRRARHVMQDLCEDFLREVYLSEQAALLSAQGSRAWTDADGVRLSNVIGCAEELVALFAQWANVSGVGPGPVAAARIGGGRAEAGPDDPPNVGRTPSNGSGGARDRAGGDVAREGRSEGRARRGRKRSTA